MILATGSTSVSLDIQIVDDSGLPVTALVAATFPAVSWSLAGPTAATAITLSDLAAITTAYTSGGVKERSNGYYRLDVPNAAFASGGEVKLFGEATGKHLLCEPIVVGNLPSNLKQCNGTTVPAGAIPNAAAGGANGLLLLDGTGTAITLTINGDLDGTVTGNVDGDVNGKLIGGGIGTPTAVGAWVADGSGNPVGTAANQTTLLTRVSAARAGYLDNLNVGGAVASHADIAALNASASRTMTLACVAQMEPGETYTVEMHTYNRATGASSNADSTPTLTAVGAVSGSLAANLTGPTNPSTAIYQWTYTVPATPTLEQIRFAGSATVAGFADSLACYTQTVDEATVVFTATDQTHLTSIFNKLPAGNLGDATDAHVLALGSPMQAGTAVTLAATQPNYAPAKAGDAMALTAGTITSIQSGLATSTLLSTVNANVLALPTAAQTAAAVRDVDNRTPAVNSLGADVNAAAQGGGGGGGTVNRPVTVIQRNTIVSD